MSEPESNAGITSLAIIGMAGRFPGAGDVDAFWRNLANGVESIRSFSPEELRESGVSPAMSGDPRYVNARGILSDAVMFDAAFFGINPREADITDPQQRVFLECAWESLEAAGYDPEAFGGSIGVYAGLGLNTYLLSNLLANPALMDVVGPYQVMLANDKDYLATRVSYKLNLKGPSVVIQTACSTSLVAVHAAYQALLDFQCDMALAGGVSIAFPQKTGYLYQEGMIASPDGHCRAFDAKANGTVEGEGVGIVVLRRLQDALAAGDNILAVIRGAAVNNDGKAKPGFTAPGVDGQAEVIAMAQALAGVHPESISYIEAHGTGTALGDPVEIAALTRSFQMRTPKTGFCALGSVKSNIGHANAAAGIAGLIKTVLALQHRQLPPTLHFEQPNPAIDFDNSPFYVNDRLREWNHGARPLRAGVSSFGIGGTNAHLVLEEAPPAGPSVSSRKYHLLPLSARTPEALDGAAGNLAKFLAANQTVNLADVAYTLQTGRRKFQHCRIVVCADAAEASELLAKDDRRRVFSARHEGENRPVVFLLSGQGAQCPGMAREIYESEPVFRQHLDYCAERLAPALGADIRSLLYSDKQESDELVDRLLQTALAQPAIFSIDYSLAKLWMSWGVVPSAFLGHSLGEYVAACLAGVFSVDDALNLVAERGRLMQSMPAGAMLSIPLGREAVEQLLDGDLALAAVNAPDLCVVAGPFNAVDRLKSRLAEQGVQAQSLRTSHAFHSPMMDGVIDAFVRKVARTPLNPPALPMMSNLTGTWLTPQQATDPAYWGRHLRQTVEFSASVSELLADPKRILLEVGPGKTLASLARRHAQPADGRVILSSLPHPGDRAPEALALFTTLGRMWASGVQVDWGAFHRDQPRKRVALPTYPFQRTEHFIPPTGPCLTVRSELEEPTKSPDLTRWFYIPSWRRAVGSLAPGGDSDPEHRRRWLVFLDELGVGEKLAEVLRRESETVVTVAAGPTFSRTDGQRYTLEPAAKEHYDTLFADLASRDCLPSNILHLFTLTGRDASASGTEALLDRGFYSVLFSVQAISAQNPSHALSIDVVSDYSQDVSGTEPTHPAKAALSVACRVMAQELPDLRFRALDLSLPDGGLDCSGVTRLLREVRAGSSDPVVAIRGTQRWVRHFEPVSLPPHAGVSPFRDGGVYLITGGLGSVGLLIASLIARTVKARLVLTSRAGLPPRSEWNSTTIHPSVAATIARIRSIEELGSEVLPVSADVANESEMLAVLDTIERRFGGLHGLVHAAGAVTRDDFVSVTELDRAHCERHFRPKLYGAEVLDRVLGNRSLDFCVLVSSLSAVLGGLTFTAYAAANACMDAYAQEHNRQGRVSWISVDWDGWLAAGAEHHGRSASLFMTPDEGVETFRRIVGSGALSHVIVSTGDLNRRFRKWVATGDHNGAVPASAQAANSPTIEDAGMGDRFTTPTEAVVAAIWKEVLGVRTIGRADDFFELGGHSLLATQVLARIRGKLGVNLPVREVFESRTVIDLAGVVDAELARRATEGSAANASIPRVSREARRVGLKDLEALGAPANGLGR